MSESNDYNEVIQPFRVTPPIEITEIDLSTRPEEVPFQRMPLMTDGTYEAPEAPRDETDDLLDAQNDPEMLAAWYAQRQAAMVALNEQLEGEE